MRDWYFGPERRVNEHLEGRGIGAPASVHRALVKPKGKE